MAETDMKAVWDETNVIISTYVPVYHKQPSFGASDKQINTVHRVNDILSIRKEVVRILLFSYMSRSNKLTRSGLDARPS